MLAIHRFLRRGGLVALLWGMSAAAAWADPQVETVKDRNVLPKQKHEQLGGKVIGLMVSDPQPVLSMEGRSGPPDSMCFARGLFSYRWVYVPTPENPLITNLQVKVGDGSQTETYPRLTMANPKSVTPWGISKPYSLVEAEVNSGKGSPADMAFVGTSFKVLDGTKDYPINVSDVVTDLKKRYADWQKANVEKIDKALAESQKSALKDKKPTGPRERSELFYITWLPDSKRVRAQFVTKISDGAYTEVMIGGPRIDPPPPPRDKIKPIREAPRSSPRAAPPRPIKMKVGTTFGVEFGMAYEVDKDGKLVRIQELPIDSFTSTIQPPPGVRPGPGGPRDPRPQPIPLPAPPAPGRQ